MFFIFAALSELEKEMSEPVVDVNDDVEDIDKREIGSSVKYVFNDHL